VKRKRLSFISIVGLVSGLVINYGCNISGWSLENVVRVDGYTMTWEISGSGPGGSKSFFASQKFLDWLWGPNQSPM
jgi:hypothetical protein